MSLIPHGNDESGKIISLIVLPCGQWVSTKTLHRFLSQGLRLFILGNWQGWAGRDNWADFGSVCCPPTTVGKLSQDSLWPSLGTPGGNPRWKVCTTILDEKSAPPISGKALKSCFNLLNGLDSFQQCLPWGSKCWCATCVSQVASRKTLIYYLSCSF